MNSKEIKEALKIINEPITVNCIEYKYFDEENYNKITNVYENCLWFANNLEQINLTVENLQKENQQLKADYGNKAQVERDLLEEENKQLKEQLQQKEDIINKAKEYVKDYKTEWTLNDEVLDDMDELLEILDNKGE